VILGFTGTRVGMTAAQIGVVWQELQKLQHSLTHVAHGDCVGADANFDRLVCQLEPRPWRLIHPSDLEHARAHCELERPLHSLAYPARPPLERNGNIVRQAALMLACPKGPEERRSGTWATVRAAVKEGKKVLIIMPNGERSER